MTGASRRREEEHRHALPAAHAALLQQLRGIDIARRAAVEDSPLVVEWRNSGVAFASSSAEMEAQYYRAVRELFSCIRPASSDEPILNEGGIYLGCWLESTGTINAELLSRFLPSIAARTFADFARHQRADGLLPYKITADGPAFSQIQIVTPLARSVWNHYLLNGRDRNFLAAMYAAMARNDEWIARFRDTRKTGGVEAFGCYDTGHDLSPRFWHMPDSPSGNDPKSYDASNPLLPLVAPDLTANIACQRNYLARIAEELDEDGEVWRDKARRSEAALFDCCYDDDDGFFYDLDNNQQFIRVQSDVLLRVLACEIGDNAQFEAALQNYLLNTRKFFARFPFASIALDDPRYDPDYRRNSWAGPTNFLSLIRAPHAFEHHHRHVELSWVLNPALQALFRAERFAQTIDPFTGGEGFTEVYSPAILCLLDFTERLSGILPRPDGALWFTGLVPRPVDHRDQMFETAYGRTVDGRHFEFVNAGGESTGFRGRELLFQCPMGVRVITDRDGRLRGITGMTVQPIAGRLHFGGRDYPFQIAANEQLDLEGGELVRVRNPGLVPPST